jgi:hypothetical protein
VTLHSVKTSMELTDSDQLILSPSVADVALAATPGRSWVIKPLHDRIAGAYSWKSVNWSAEQWRRRLTNPRVRYATVTIAGQAAGMVEFESQPQSQVEISMFGLLPEFNQPDVANYAFSLASRAAWQLPDARNALPKRVWLNLPDLCSVPGIDYEAHGYAITCPA